MSNTDTSSTDSEMEVHSDAVEYEYNAPTTPSIAIVEAICALEDIDPMEMPTEGSFILREYINPNALNTLLAESPGDGSTVVSFEIASESTYLVDISDDGRFLVRFKEAA